MAAHGEGSSWSASENGGRKTVDRGTKAELLTRATNGKADWPGGFTERPLQLSDLRLGDYVTVVAEQEGKQVVATRVEVVRPTSTAVSQ